MTSIINRMAQTLRAEAPSLNTEVEKSLMATVEKARARHNTWKPIWAEPLAFIEGRHFVFRSKAGTAQTLNELDTTAGGAKPNYRSRTVRNRVLDFWLSEVSAGTQRVPQYEVTPTSTDPEIIAAARLSEKVLMYLYDFLDLRPALVEAYGYAVACGEGFIRPYWNAHSGDPLPADPEYPDEQLFTGDLCLDALGPDQVMWEPGASFEESPYHIIEQAQTISYVRRLPGFTGVELKPDTNGHQSFVQGQLNKSAAKGDMVTLTEYLELPSHQNPRGRRLLMASGQLVVPPEPYPLVVKGPKGYEPCIHRVSFIRTPWRDRDMGLVEHLLDSQRIVNDAVNKADEWMKLVLLPQLLAPRNSIKNKDRPTTEPGQIVWYDGQQAPQWRTVPPIPESVFEMKQDAIADMEAISSQRSVPNAVESGKGQATFIEQEQRRSQMQIQGLADFHSRLGKHLLYWVQQRYTEERLLSIEGRHGVEYIPDFKGANLRDQTAVRVLPGSIEPLTRAAIEQKVMNFAQLGWISKEEGLAAINNGTAQNLIEDYELDVAKQNREIQAMIAMGNEQMPGGDVPIASEYDNHSIHRTILRRWLLTKEFEESPIPVQEAAKLHDQQHKMFEQQQMMEQAQQQNMQAEQMGMDNAAKPQNGAKPLPSLPSVSNGQQ